MKKILRAFIREQLAVANLVGATKGFFHNYSDPPIGFDEIADYNYDIISDVNRGYLLTITNSGKQVGDSMLFQDYDEALHNAKIIIDKHRITSNNNEEKK